MAKMASASRPPRGRRREKPTPWSRSVRAKSEAKAKFDETIEISMNLGIDPATPTRWSAAWSACPTAPARPSAWASSPVAPRPTRPRAAGADVVGDEDLAAAVQGGTIDFDRCIATPDMMALVGPAR
jgi:large subunit ribosomal protein L1